MERGIKRGKANLYYINTTSLNEREKHHHMNEAGRIDGAREERGEDTVDMEEKEQEEEDEEEEEEEPSMAEGGYDTQLLDDDCDERAVDDDNALLGTGDAAMADMDADESSGGGSSSSSYAAETSSGGTNTSRSCSMGGYAGDYSSISDYSSSAYRRRRDSGSSSSAEKKSKAGDGKGIMGGSARVAGGIGAATAGVGDEAGAEGGADVVADGGLSSRVGGDSANDNATMMMMMQRPREGVSSQSPPMGHHLSELMNGHAAAVGRSCRHNNAPLSGEHIHSHHRYGNNHSHHHHAARGGNKAHKQQPVVTKEVNRQIDQIMNLYNVSLQAATIRDSNEAAEKLRVVAEATKDHRCGRHRHHKGGLEERLSEGSSSLQVEAEHGDPAHVAPQLGGLRINDPSDPMIDVRRLYGTATGTVLNIPSSAGIDDNAINGNGNGNDNIKNDPSSRDQGGNDASTAASPSRFLEAPADCVNTGRINIQEGYANLMEACRPFFSDSHALMASKPPPMLPTTSKNDNNVVLGTRGEERSAVMMAHAATAAAEGSNSSNSGFTSFFTSTKSESGNQTNSLGGSGGSQFSETSTSRRQREKSGIEEDWECTGAAAAAASGRAFDEQVPDCGKGAAVATSAEGNQAGANSANNNSEDQSDASSMVVLYRVKRKHKEQSQQHHQQQLQQHQAATAASTSSSNLIHNANGTARKRDSAATGDATESTGTRKRVRIETVALEKKHRRPPQDVNSSEAHQGGGGSDDTSSSPAKQGDRIHQQQQQQRTESFSLTSSLTQSLDSSGSDSGGLMQRQDPEKADDAGGGGSSNAEAGHSNTDSIPTQNRPSSIADGGGGSANQSSSTSISKQPQGGRVVTDITSSGTTTANGSSGSGTGSGNDNNTTSNKSESGSGEGGLSGAYSNSNSDVGQKASDGGGCSHGDNSTSACGTGSDGCGGLRESSRAVHARTPEGEGGAKKDETRQPVHNGAGSAHVKADKPLIHHHHHGAACGGGHHNNKNEANLKPPPELLANTNGSELPVATGNDVINGGGGNVHYNAVFNQDAQVPPMDVEQSAMVSKEKIMEKKRKRMNMRREYEEEVQRQMRDSSESSSIAAPHDNNAALEPGMPVTLEEVLSFTKISRLLVQALPPFLAVHVNAAFTSLCGIQSSVAIGTPVASIVSLPDINAANNKESDSSGSGSAGSKDAMSSLSGSADGNNSNMAIANLAGDRAHQGGGASALEGVAADNNHLQNGGGGVGLRIDRLIVARGYGHIHDVEVQSVPQHHAHKHTIEGSEVKFIEGKNGPAAKRKKKDYSKIRCRMSVSPVISAAHLDPHGRHHHHGGGGQYVDTNSCSLNKRRKIKDGFNSVNHYLIQLEAIDGPRLLVSRSSYTSSSTDTTMEARLMGITKTEVYARRCRLERSPVQNQMGMSQTQQQQQGNNDHVDHRTETDESQDGNASMMEPAATCG